MKRVEAIWNHPLYRQEYERLQRMEIGRKYCGHSVGHFLDVARACWIRVLEEEIDLSKEVVYAAALLHDIGKGLQYEVGTPHHEAGARLAGEILPDCGFGADETKLIVNAILLHRRPVETDEALVRLLYEADKKTRLCFCCAASGDCNWPEEKKNRFFV